MLLIMSWVSSILNKNFLSIITSNLPPSLIYRLNYTTHLRRKSRSKEKVMRHSILAMNIGRNGELYKNYFLIPYWLTAFVLLISPHFYSTKKSVLRRRKYWMKKSTRGKERQEKNVEQLFFANSIDFSSTDISRAT